MLGHVRRPVAPIRDQQLRPRRRHGSQFYIVRTTTAIMDRPPMLTGTAAIEIVRYHDNRRAYLDAMIHRRQQDRLRSAARPARYSHPGRIRLRQSHGHRR